MQPQQPYYGTPQQPTPAPPPGQNPYDFIVNSGKPPRRSLLGGGMSKVQRIAVMVGGAAIVLIILIVIINMMFSGSGNATVDIKVAQDQTEIARVAGLGVQQQNVGQETKNVAITAQLTLTSDRQQLTSYLQKNGVKISDKELAALQSPQTDQQLTAASTTSTYDSTFLSIMQTDLGNYQQTLNTAYQGSKSTALRQLLRGQYANAGLLLEQIKSAQE